MASSDELFDVDEEENAADDDAPAADAVSLLSADHAEDEIRTAAEAAQSASR